jgi:integrase
MKQALNTMAGLLTDSECDLYTLDWAALRYQHTAALRAALAKKYAPTTANKMLSALRRVLKEALRLGLMSGEDYARAADVADIRVTPLLRGRALSQKEIAALMKACTDDPSPAGARDAAAIAILRGGLRRSEVVALEVKDFDSDTGALEIRQGKGRKDRIAYLPKNALAAVNDWLNVRGQEPGALLCPVHQHTIIIRHLSDQSVLAILKKRLQSAGVEPFSPHDFRRTFISDLLDAGADIVTVQKLAGHSNTATTAKYDRRGEVAKRRAVDLLDMPYQGR